MYVAHHFILLRLSVDKKEWWLEHCFIVAGVIINAMESAELENMESNIRRSIEQPF